MGHLPTDSPLVERASGHVIALSFGSLRCRLPPFRGR
jgi:hypothetical protein